METLLRWAACVNCQMWDKSWFAGRVRRKMLFRMCTSNTFLSFFTRLDSQWKCTIRLVWICFFSFFQPLSQRENGALEGKAIRRKWEREREWKSGGEMSACWVLATSGTVYHLVQTGNERLIQEHSANLRSARAGLKRSIGIMTAFMSWMRNSTRSATSASEYQWKSGETALKMRGNWYLERIHTATSICKVWTMLTTSQRC